MEDMEEPGLCNYCGSRPYLIPVKYGNREMYNVMCQSKCEPSPVFGPYDTGSEALSFWNKWVRAVKQIENLQT